MAKKEIELKNDPENESPLTKPEGEANLDALNEKELSLSDQLKGVKDTVDAVPTPDHSGEESEEEEEEEEEALKPGVFSVVSNESKDHLFNVYVNGVDVRHVHTPEIEACPWVFSWKKLGQTANWKIFDGENLPDGIDVTVCQDDTPLDKIVTIGQVVLCYMEKSAFNH